MAGILNVSGNLNKIDKICRNIKISIVKDLGATLIFRILKGGRAARGRKRILKDGMPENGDLSHGVHAYLLWLEIGCVFIILEDTEGEGIFLFGKASNEFTKSF